MRTILILSALLLAGCGANENDYIILQKVVHRDNPKLANYGYLVGFSEVRSVDSSHKFNVGDDIRKYSMK